MRQRLRRRNFGSVTGCFCSFNLCVPTLFVRAGWIVDDRFQFSALLSKLGNQLLTLGSRCFMDSLAINLDSSVTEREVKRFQQSATFVVGLGSGSDSDVQTTQSVDLYRNRFLGR